MKKAKDSNYVTLTCTEMDPYVIYVEESQYTVVEPVDKYEKTYGYYGSLSIALKKVAQLLTLKGESTMTVEGYINKFQSILNELTKKVTV